MKKRIYIFTGKGGVGKTSVAAAHAIKSAQEGYRTLLVSTDMAHNLGDLFEMTLGKEPVKIVNDLDAYEIDPNYVMENDFEDMIKCLEKMIPISNGLESFGMFPGMEELFSLLKIGEIYKEGKYERIMVDCAPTGETLSLLKFPELLSWYMEKLFPIGKVAVRILAPVSKQFFKVELPNKAAMTDIEKMYLKLSELQELLKDRETTSIRLVTIPEKMVVEETKRNYMYMNLYNFNVDGIYINRILPSEINNKFFEDWLKIQKKYITQLKESFAGLPIYEIPWYDEELRGMKAVKRICSDALTTDIIFEPKVMTQRESFEKNENGYVLTVFVPNAKKEDLDLFQSETDVVIKLGNFKRNIPLPNVLRIYNITTANLEEGSLTIQFEKGEKEDE
ncbi:ArsA family ATPase [Anaerosacchariphilus polymeriproducens]|uniref:arsenite-transporting ATPase n=1 Tax=Anaerosacchariphilus polymeriproducens TaxID=1812858 RepID=A0A371AQV5_9FIRM|nr:ArsA family ATPase [Anaerosacchariphilus polymeriproducens]RDU21961.1 ArsA family ATPase [Anaerosacchariphilus polymeriproducens]